LQSARSRERICSSKLRSRSWRWSRATESSRAAGQPTIVYRNTLMSRPAYRNCVRKCIASSERKGANCSRRLLSAPTAAAALDEKDDHQRDPDDSKDRPEIFHGSPPLGNAILYLYSITFVPPWA
jgi:hypothetical protein